MPGTIREASFEADLAELLKEFGAVVEEVFDALEWELMHTSNFDHYPLVADDAGGTFHMIVSLPTRRAPQLVLLFGFETFNGDEKLLFIGLRARRPPQPSVSTPGTRFAAPTQGAPSSDRQRT